MTPEVMAWVREVVQQRDVQGKLVLEVGAGDVNGSVRPMIEAMGPRRYIGTDIAAGPRVDKVCAAEDLIDTFGRARFDLVISTEMLEHAEDWRAAVWNMMVVLKDGGTMIVTTRSPGFPRHDWPSDYWRFALEDFYWIWAGWYMDDLRTDPALPGVFIRARKPPGWDDAASWTRLGRLKVAPAPQEDMP